MAGAQAVLLIAAGGQRDQPRGGKAPYRYQQGVPRSPQGQTQSRKGRQEDHNVEGSDGQSAQRGVRRPPGAERLTGEQSVEGVAQKLVEEKLVDHGHAHLAAEMYKRIDNGSPDEIG